MDVECCFIVRKTLNLRDSIEPQIKRLQRLIYMSAVSPETTLQRYEIILNWHFIFYEGKNCEHKARDPLRGGDTKIKVSTAMLFLLFYADAPA